MLNVLIAAISMCDIKHSAVVHTISRALLILNKSRCCNIGLVQRILMCDATRLCDRTVICSYLLNPLTLGLALKDVKKAQFEDLINTVRILLDIVEHLKDTVSDADSSHKNSLSSFGQMSSRRVSMSSSNLPLVMVTAARPTCSSFGYDSSLRKISCLSVDGRLDDRSQITSKMNSKSSLESNLSLKLGNTSDASDEQQSSSLMERRRQSWLDTDISHLIDQPVTERVIHERKRCESERRWRMSSPAMDEVSRTSQPTRPNSFTNLGHNLACTLWKSFY
ncbi:unnamed protein product [Litomosoides sigmodontis]|uniref:Uncharacterized protein n=1 Tax=Litomosoides sigmodontis TaxID=42156 RepID=A0A3P6TEK0_LITSI|nr:unnamed protein product [Litomosoides sigmodontis]